MAITGARKSCPLFVRSALNGICSWSTDLDESAFLSYISEFGLEPLLRECLSFDSWPESIKSAIDLESKRQVAIAMMREHETARVLSAFSNNGIQNLLLKGAGLAYTHYREPHLRPRCDTDIFIRKMDFAKTTTILEDLGYARQNAVSGELITNQGMFSNGTDQFDIHCGISMTQYFSEILTFEESYERSVPIALAGARTLGPVHALLLACVHRVAHHHNTENPLWLYDMHLLVSKMTRSELHECASLASRKKVISVCREGLRLTSDYFGTSVPDLWKGDAEDESAKFLQPDLNRFDLLRLDLEHLSFGRKLKLLREHLFPPATYMLHAYSLPPSILLPALYLHRGITGAWKWLRK